MPKADIGVIGLAVMGQNLILNMNDHGYHVVAYNRTTAKVDEFLQGAAKGTNISGAHSIPELVEKLKSPRIIMLMVRAGDVVDQFIDQLVPHLAPGDIIIDGGNSHYPDTTRRVHTLRDKGIRYVGAGVSGGEEGARHGPSIMPGGDIEAWPHIKPILQAIAAKTPDGEPCCDWVGADGAGPFVKMVHNGIEYGDMQLICEAYHIMKDGLGLDHDAMHRVFSEWNKTELDSYLIQITAAILAYKDTDGSPLVEHILDTAGQKGTGKWTAINALDYGIPLTLISEAVHGWHINYGATAMLWREGCIIRSRFLGDIRDAYAQDPDLNFLGAAPYFRHILQQNLADWRQVVAAAISHGIPVPCMASALTFLDGYTSAQLPANLLQAQRDYFGAHTYERTDQPRGKYHHTNWTGTGGDTASTTYDA